MMFRTCSPLRRILAAVLAGAFALSAVAVMPAATASASLSYGIAQPLQFPPDVEYTSPAESAVAVSCWSAGNCVTVGKFVDTANIEEAFTARSTNGVWETAQPVAFPEGMQDPSHYSNLVSVSCSGPADCTAAGYFAPAGGGGGRAFTITMTDGVWADPVPLSLPEGSGSSAFYSVDCASPGNCSAVGNFWDPNGHRRGLIASSTSGAWGQGFPAEFDEGVEYLDAFTNTRLSAVDCPAADSCTAVGQEGFGGVMEAFTVSAVGGVWQHARIATFGDDVERAGVGLRNDRFNAVSCAAVGECTAAGYFMDRSGEVDGWLSTVAFTQTSVTGVWGDALPAIPADARNIHRDSFDSISCSAPGTCTAVGVYAQTYPSEDPMTTDPGSGFTPLVRSSVGGVWGPALGAPGAKAFRNHYSDSGAFTSVSCSSPGNCVAVGPNRGGNPLYANVIGTMTDGVWAPLTGAPLAPESPVAMYGSTGLTAIDCTGTGYCTAVGYYTMCPPDLRETNQCWTAGNRPTPRSGPVGQSDPQASSHAFAVRIRRDGQLPPTGSNPLAALAVGLALCASGGALLRSRRRRLA